MERGCIIHIDSLPGDVWRLICEQLESLTDLQTILLLNKSCNNYCQHNIKKEKSWHEKLKYRMGMIDTNIYSSILPSKLLHFVQKHRPSLKLNRENDFNINKPIKIIIVGSGRSGQTTYLRLVSGSEHIGEQTATFGRLQTNFVVKSPHRDFTIDLWDIGITKSGFLRDAYHEGAMGAIVFCDTASRGSRKCIASCIRSVRRISENIPLVVCMNKADLPFGHNGSNKSVPRELSRLMGSMKSKNFMFCEISNWAKYCVHEPLIWIMQQLTGDDTLELTFPPMSSELHGTINIKIIRAGIEARKQLENDTDD